MVTKRYARCPNTQHSSMYLPTMSCKQNIKITFVSTKYEIGMSLNKKLAMPKLCLFFKITVSFDLLR